MSNPRKPTGNSAEAIHAQWVHERLANEAKLGRVSGHRVHNTTHGQIVIPSRSGGSRNGVTLEMYVLAVPTVERPLVVEDDYLICRTWDPAAFAAAESKLASESGVVTGLGTTDILIAKLPDHRCSITKKWVLNQRFTYTYDEDSESSDHLQNKTRNSLQHINEETEGDEESQKIIPPWCPSWIKGVAPYASRYDVIAELEDEEEEEEQPTNYFNPGDVIFAIEVDSTGVTVDGEEITLLYSGDDRQWASTNLFQ